MTQDEGNAIRQAIAAWHEKLRSAEATGALGQQNGSTQERNTAVTVAAHQLASCLEDKQLPDGLIDDLLGVCEAFVRLSGPLPFGASGMSLFRSSDDRADIQPPKAKLNKAAPGLPVHTTSIGRSASASYCVDESMGGWETLSAAVESLYNRMRDDDRCASLFTEANEQSLKTHMLEFVSCALGGKARLATSTLLTSQRDQLRSHGFGAGQFDLLLQHMKAVLDELGLQPEVAASAIALLRCNRYLFEKRAPESAEEAAAAAVGDH